MPKSVGARTQPCFTPLLTGKASQVAPLKHTVMCMLSWNDVTTASRCFFFGGGGGSRSSGGVWRVRSCWPSQRPSLNRWRWGREASAAFGTSLEVGAGRIPCPPLTGRHGSHTGTLGRRGRRGFAGELRRRVRRPSQRCWEGRSLSSYCNRFCRPCFCTGWRWLRRACPERCILPPSIGRAVSAGAQAKQVPHSSGPQLGCCHCLETFRWRGCCWLCWAPPL